MTYKVHLPALAALILLVGGGASFADPINYTIAFYAPRRFRGRPPGWLVYAPNVGFSNFLVDWADFEIASSANAPALASDPATGCDSAAYDPILQ